MSAFPVLSEEELERVGLQSWHEQTMRRQAQAHERVLRLFAEPDRFPIEAYAEACAAEALARAALARAR